MLRSRHALFAVVLVFALLFSAIVIAAEKGKEIPDFSMKPRSEVPAQYTWRLEDIYPAYEDWQKDKDAVVKLIAQIDEKKKGWTESAQKMADLYELTDAIARKGARLFSYASFQSDVAPPKSPVIETICCWSSLRMCARWRSVCSMVNLKGESRGSAL